MTKDTCKEKIWELANLLRSAVYSRNIAFSVLRLLFLKYALDNCIGAKTVEDMQVCVKAQRMFARKDVEDGISTIIPVLNYIDRAYQIDVLSGERIVDEYARELFGADRMTQKKNATESSFKSVIEFLGEMDLEEKDSERSLGKLLVHEITELIQTGTDRNAFTGEFTTGSDLNRLAKEILQVKKEDRFLDFTAGIGLSTLEITGDTLPYVTHVERDPVVAALAAMLYIMQGYQEFYVSCSDALVRVLPEATGNRIFIDPPLMARVEKTDWNPYTNASFAALHLIMRNYLHEDTVAAMTVPSGTLFQTKKQAVALREELVTAGMLKAVIALPPLWRGTNVSTNLLVMSGECNAEGVLFIDAAEEAKTPKSRSKGGALTEETVERILQALRTRDTVPGFSRVAAVSELQQAGFNLIPANYITQPTEEDNTTIEEIDAQLAELYRQLME